MSIVQHYRHGTRPYLNAVRRGDPLTALRHIRDRYFDPAGLESNWFAIDWDDSGSATAQWRPLVDVKEEADGFVIYADLPGVDPDAIEVQMDKGILSIRGERAAQENRQDARYSRQERQSGVFHRRFALPDSADAERISAHGHNGVLQVCIPKKPETTPRRIQVAGTTSDRSASDVDRAAASDQGAPDQGSQTGHTPTVQ